MENTKNVNGSNQTVSPIPNQKPEVKERKKEVKKKEESYNDIYVLNYINS